MRQTAFRPIRFFVLMFFMCNFIHISNANSATINAASCSQVDVQTAINSASDGDIVIVPAGNCIWTSTVFIPDTKGIILQGAGIDQTTIIDATGASDVLSITSAEGKPFRVTGFTFDGNGTSKSGILGAIKVTGDCRNFRIDHIEFEDMVIRSIVTSAKGDEQYGVIDHCTFDYPYSTSSQGIALFGAKPQDRTPWKRPLTLGTYKAIYIEDCTFTWATPPDSALDAYGGARYVFRYNKVTGTHVSHHGCDSGDYRSTHSFEIYENTFNENGAGSYRALFFRGGTGVVYNNTFTGNYSGFNVANYRSCDSYGVWGKCDGKNPLDGNEDETGYPCLDQIGRTTNQALSPLYEWNNTINRNDLNITVSTSCPELADHIQEYRDYYNDTQKPGYTPYEYPHPLQSQSTNTYYVDNSGSPACSDSSSYGSESQPWCTISYALTQMSGGDDLYVKAGTYNETTFTISSSLSGSASDRTVIQVYPSDTVTIQGAGVNTGRLKIDGANYVTFDGFKVTNMNQGIFVEGGAHDVIIQECEVYYIGQEAIHVKENSYDIVLQGNTIYDTHQYDWNGEGFYIGTGSAGPLDNTNNVTIYNNIIYNVRDEAIELKSGTHDCTVDGNTIYNSGVDLGSTSGNIEVMPHSGGAQSWGLNPSHVIKNNIIHDNSGGSGIRAGTGCTVYNNVLYDIINYGIYVDNQSGDSYTRKIYHNTIDISSSNAIYISTGKTDIKNNIGSLMENNMATNDTYFFSTQEGSEDYHLVSGSTPIDAGIDLTGTVAVDLDGNSRPTGSAVDLGAYEYSLDTTDTTPPVRSGGSPTGTLASGTTSTTLSLTTNENATCRYSTTAGVSYSSMTDTFSTTGETSHSTTVSGLSNGDFYSYYVRCEDDSGNANTSDYGISFSVAVSDVVSYKWVQAESENITSPLETALDPDASAGTYMWKSSGSGDSATPDGAAEYTIDIPTTGDYVIWGRVIAPDGGCNSFFTSIDAGEDFVWGVQIGSVWTWDSVNGNAQDPLVFNLVAGTHTLRISGREDGTKLDRLLITNDMDFVPSEEDPDNVPPPDVSNFTDSAGDVSINLTWTNPTDFDFAGTMIRYSTESYPLTRNDGIAVPNDNDGKFFKPIDNFLHSGLQNHTRYYYSSFACDEVPNYSEAAHASATPTPTPDAIAPTVTITQPTSEGSYSTSQSTLTVGGSASDNIGVTSVTWINSRGGSGTASGTSNWTISNVSLQEGDNVITVTAHDAAGNSGVNTLTVTYTLPDMPLSYNWFQAESENITSPLETVSDPDASAGAYIWKPSRSGDTTAPDGVAEYTIDIPTTGDYVIWGRVIAPDGGCNSFFTSIDGGEHVAWHIPIGSVWIWVSVNGNEQDPLILNLAAGIHTLRISGREDGTKLDRLLITNDMDFVPSEENPDNVPPADVRNLRIE